MGLPNRYWSVQPSDGRQLAGRLGSIGSKRSWLDVSDRVREIGVPRQRKTLARLFDDDTAFDRSYVLGIGSEPTDGLAMTLAAAVMRRAQTLKLRPLCISMRERPDDTSLSFDPDVAILHNLPADCHQMRTQVCRDWLDLLDDSFRIVVVAGADPYSFVRRRLAYPIEIDAVLYLRGDVDEDV